TIVPEISARLAIRAYNVTLTVPPEPLYLFNEPPRKPIVQPQPERLSPPRLARKEGTAGKITAPPVKPVTAEAPPPAEVVQSVFKPTPAATDKKLLVESPGVTTAPVFKSPSVAVPQLRAESKIDRPVEPVAVGMFEVSKTVARSSSGVNGAVEVGGFGT